MAVYKSTIVVCTGGFDPIHSGHIKYLNSAKQLGDKLIIGVNSDDWLIRKKGQPFLPFNERKTIVENLKCVDLVLPFDDSDGSAVNLLKQLRQEYPDSMIIFANGGDRTATNIPETILDDIVFKFAVGGTDKTNSSSWILEEYKAPKTKREWGYYRVLHTDGPEVKLKELTVDPGKKLSMQTHDLRSEFWFVSKGQATVYTYKDDKKELVGVYGQHKYLHIKNKEYHQLSNETNEPLKIIEIQYGTNCIEEDIIRQNVS